VIYGNFSADHLKMRQPGTDICLTDGDLYMVATEEYEHHLKKTIDSSEVMYQLLLYCLVPAINMQ